MRNRRGVILVTVLWIFFLVGIMALGLGRLGTEELSLLRISLGRLRAYAAARSGLAVTEQRLLNQSVVQVQPGAMSYAERKKLYAGVPAGSGTYFDVGFKRAGAGSGMFWGPADEAARFNINRLDGPGVAADTLRFLVDRVAAGEGEAWVRGIVDFRNGPQRNGKTRPFYALEELLYVSGISPDVFRRLRSMLTVYPYEPTGVFQLNIFEADSLLVEAAFQAAAAYVGANAAADSRSFLQCRERSPESQQCALPAYLGVMALSKSSSGTLHRIRSTGVDSSSGMRLSIEEVVSLSGAGRAGVQILYWHRD